MQTVQPYPYMYASDGIRPCDNVYTIIRHHWLHAVFPSGGGSGSVDGGLTEVQTQERKAEGRRGMGGTRRRPWDVRMQWQNGAKCNWRERGRGTKRQRKDRKREAQCEERWKGWEGVHGTTP